MGKRGPAPTPGKLLQMRGSSLAKDRVASEVKAPLGTPRMPAWLHGHARTAWKRIVPQLRQMGILAKVDREELEAYCVTYGRWRQILRELEDDGLVQTETTREKNKRRVLHPLAAVEKDLRTDLARMRSRFGMTPAARAGLSVNSKEGAGGAAGEADPFAKRA